MESPFNRVLTGDWGEQDWSDSSDTLLQGGGLAVADFDGDGGLDVFLPNAGAAQLFLASGPGEWRESSDRLPSGLDGAVGATVADLDGDGDLDLLVTRMLATNLLLWNNGAGFFTATSLDALAYRSVSAAAADGDGDGDLDLMLANYGEAVVVDTDHPNLRYQNDGTGDFTLVSLAEPLARGHSLGLLWQDLTGDGQPDVYVANDFGWMHANQLGVNVNGALLVDSIKGVNLVTNAMGIAVGELNGDGLPDLMVSGWGELILLMSLTVETGWVDATHVVGLVPPLRSSVAWAAEFGDLDNDGDEDLYVVFGWLDASLEGEGQAVLDQSDAIYLQQRDGTFLEVGESWGVAVPTIGRGMVLADLTGNGFLDVIKRDQSGPAQIWLAKCDDSAWLEIDLRQFGPNPFAIGAEVRVKTGERVRTRWLRAGGTGHASSGPPEVHIGLGDHERVDRVEVVWPDGMVSQFFDVNTRQRVRIERWMD
ncbi:MAG: hypothetical protein GWP91_04395 [Rhodobacterales bacterium]|nr:hypothetical protein [Rhodobacterales bacterium]